jgi:DUF1707 SHOCT-like domain
MVMPGLGNEMAAGAAGRGFLRASDADREQAVDALKAAFVRGQLARDELDLRIGQALRSRTWADLDALIAGLATAQSPEPAREPDGKKLIARATAWRPWAWQRPVFLVTGALLLFAGMMLGSTVAFICGMLLVGASAPDASPCSPTTAVVRMWQSLYKSRVHHL